MMHPRVDRPRDTSEATAGVTWESRGIFRIVVVFAATHRCRCRRPRFSSTRTRLQSPSLAAALNPNSEILVYTTFAMFVRRERVTVKRVPYTFKNFRKSGRSSAKCFYIFNRWEAILRLPWKMGRNDSIILTCHQCLLFSWLQWLTSLISL